MMLSWTFAWILSVGLLPGAPWPCAAPQDAAPAVPVRQARKQAVKDEAPNAKADLAAADRARRAVKSEGAERRRALEAVAKAYEAVVLQYPEAKAEGAMASFRLGEIRRTLGDFEGALEAFEKAASAQGDRRLQARALYETAQTLRRRKELGKAMAAYRRVVLEVPEEAATRDDALAWIGVLHERSGEHAKAREAWQAVADRGQDPLDRVRAFDRMALSHVKEGNRELAAETVERARAALLDAASEPSSRGARVKKALERMRAVRALEPADTAVKASSGGAPPLSEGEDDVDEFED